MSDSKAKILVQNTKWIYISKIVSQILVLIANILVIRKLAVDIFGTYNLLISTFVLFEIFALSSVIKVFNRYIPELIVNKEYRKFKRFINGGFLFSTLVFTVLTAILFLTKDLFASFFNIENFDKYILAFFIFNYANFLKILTDMALKSLLLHKKVAIITIINTLLRTLLYIVLLDKLDVNLLLYIEVFLAITYLSQGLHVYFKYTSKFDYTQKPEKTTPVTFKRVRKYGLYSIANELGVGIIGKTSDYFIVAAMANPFAVGIFAFAHRMYGMVFKMLPFDDFMTVVRPLFFQKYIKEYEIAEFRKMYSFILKVLIPLYVLPAVYFLFFGKHIINIVFDPKYIDAYWVTVIILSSNLYLASYFPLGLTVTLKERMDAILYSRVVVIFSIFAGIYGMKYFGIIGVASASLIGNFLKNVFIYIFMRKYKEIKYSFNDYKNYLIMLLLTSPFILLHFININIYILILLSILFFIYFAVIFFFLHPFEKYDIEMLNKMADTSPVLIKVKAVIIFTHNLLRPNKTYK